MKWGLSNYEKLSLWIKFEYIIIQIAILLAGQLYQLFVYKDYLPALIYSDVLLKMLMLMLSYAAKNYNLVLFHMTYCIEILQPFTSIRALFVLKSAIEKPNTKSVNLFALYAISEVITKSASEFSQQDLMHILI